LTMEKNVAVHKYLRKMHSKLGFKLPFDPIHWNGSVVSKAATETILTAFHLVFEFEYPNNESIFRDANLHQ
jgi:hypothetical protein